MKYLIDYKNDIIRLFSFKICKCMQCILVVNNSNILHIQFLLASQHILWSAYGFFSASIESSNCCHVYVAFPGTLANCQYVHFLQQCGRWRNDAFLSIAPCHLKWTGNLALDSWDWESWSCPSSTVAHGRATEWGRGQTWVSRSYGSESRRAAPGPSLICQVAAWVREIWLPITLCQVPQSTAWTEGSALSFTSCRNWESGPYALSGHNSTAHSRMRESEWEWEQKWSSSLLPAVFGDQAGQQ